MTLWDFINKIRFEDFVVVSPITKEEIKFSYSILRDAELYAEEENDYIIIDLSNYYIKSVDFEYNVIYLLTDRA